MVRKMLQNGKVSFKSLTCRMFLVGDCRFSTAQKLDKLGMRGSDTYVKML